jgi:hypothetical protein
VQHDDCGESECSVSFLFHLMLCSGSSSGSLACGVLYWLTVCMDLHKAVTPQGHCHGCSSAAPCIVVCCVSAPLIQGCSGPAVAALSLSVEDAEQAVYKH